MRLRFALVFLTSLLTACSGPDPEISAQITAQFEASDGARVDLSGLGPKSWTRVCVLSPYNDNAQAEKVLGFKWDVEGKTSLSENDGVNVLVFATADEVVAYTEHQRGKGDLKRMMPRCLPRALARLVGKPDSDPRNAGWIHLEPERQ